MPFKRSSTIEVEVRGEIENEGIFILERGSTFQDLLSHLQVKEDADLSLYPKSMDLYHKDLLVIPKTSEEEKISINTAGVEELMTLKGIGEKTAMRIIEYRKENGPFKRLEELKNVAGIKEKTYAKIKDFITL